jgi:hypothetical protein
MVDHIVYHYLQATQLGQHFEIPPELTEEEQLVVAVLINAEKEKRAFPDLEDALVLSVAPPPPPSPPPLQPPRTPLRPRRDARMEPWDPWPGAMPSLPATSPPVIGWAPATPTPPLGPPPPPVADWPWP